MKKTTITLIPLLLGVIVILSITSCDLSGISIDARIDSFLYDLNFDRNNVYTNFHQTATSAYDSLKNPTLTIDPVFPVSGIAYSRGALDTSDPSDVTTVISGGGGWGSKNASFVMIKDGSTWYINDLFLNGSPVYQ